MLTLKSSIDWFEMGFKILVGFGPGSIVNLVNIKDTFSYLLTCWLESALGPVNPSINLSLLHQVWVSSPTCAPREMLANGINSGQSTVRSLEKRIPSLWISLHVSFWGSGLLIKDDDFNWVATESSYNLALVDQVAVCNSGVQFIASTSCLGLVSSVLLVESCFQVNDSVFQLFVFSLQFGELFGWRASCGTASSGSCSLSGFIDLLGKLVSHSFELLEHLFLELLNWISVNLVLS